MMSNDTVGDVIRSRREKLEELRKKNDDVIDDLKRDMGATKEAVMEEPPPMVSQLSQSDVAALEVRYLKAMIRSQQKD